MDFTRQKVENIGLAQNLLVGLGADENLISTPTFLTPRSITRSSSVPAAVQ